MILNKKICFFIGSRANYSSIKSLMREVRDDDDLIFQLVLGSSSILERFGNVANLIEQDGFKIDFKFYNNLEGDNPVTMTKSSGLLMIELSSILESLKPDLFVVVGDRYEVMTATITAAYMNIKIAHTMGGEVTGTIDESIRHAITKFSHIHFPSNEDAKQRIIKMGEVPDNVFNLGCPRIDLVREILLNDSTDFLKANFKNIKGVHESDIDFDKPFLLVSQHPVTTEFENSRDQIKQTLLALNELKIQTVFLWPNSDAGNENISKEIRTFRNIYSPKWLFLYKNLPIEVYVHLMNTTLCLIGNSSSGIREGAFIGTPVVNIGTRQNKRMHGSNVMHCKNESNEIINNIKQQIKSKKYNSEPVYGDGFTAKKMVNIIKNLEDISVQKTIHY